MDNPALDLEFEEPRNKRNAQETLNNLHPEKPQYEAEELLYGIDDVPPWYMCLFLGLQVMKNSGRLKCFETEDAVDFINFKCLALPGDDRSNSGLSILPNAGHLYGGR